MINEIYALCIHIEKSATGLLCRCSFHRAVLPQISSAVSRVLRVFFPSHLPLFFFSTTSASSSFLLPIFFIASASLFCSPTERVIYCQQQRPQNLKPVRVYTFCVRLFTPCITMHAHVRIILSRVIHYQLILRASLEKIRKL